MDENASPKGLDDSLKAAGESIPKILDAVKTPLSYATLLAVSAAIITIVDLFGSDRNLSFRVAVLVVAIILASIASWFVWASHLKVKTHLVRAFKHVESQPLCDFLKASPLPMFITEQVEGQGLIIRHCNPALVKFSGLPQKRIQGKSVKDLISHLRSCIPPEHQDAFDKQQAARVAALEEGAPPNDFFFTVIDNKRLDPVDGRIHDVSVRTFSMTDHKANEIGACSVWMTIPWEMRNRQG